MTSNATNALTEHQPSAPASSPLPPAVRRERIGLRVTVILSSFWLDQEASRAERVLELEGWLDVLEPLDDTEVRAAWAEYQRSGPRSAAGKLLRPDAGALYRIAMQARANAARLDRLRNPPPPPPPPPVIDDAERERRRAFAEGCLKSFGEGLKDVPSAAFEAVR